MTALTWWLARVGRFALGAWSPRAEDHLPDDPLLSARPRDYGWDAPGAS
jgi:hypothetical protein